MAYLHKWYEIIDSRNPCFSGQCFAMNINRVTIQMETCRNPCFSGQCFAIPCLLRTIRSTRVAILVLVDSVLQYHTNFQ